MKLLSFAGAALILALVPAAASATHFTGITGSGNCDGWELGVDVYYRVTTHEADVSYTLTLVDEDANVVETVDWSGTITRDDPSDVDQHYDFSGSWETGELDGSYTIHAEFTLSATFGDGEIDEDSMSFEHGFLCESVATKALNWSAVKGLYE